jgi:hypothetical protein
VFGDGAANEMQTSLGKAPEPYQFCGPARDFGGVFVLPRSQAHPAESGKSGVCVTVPRLVSQHLLPPVFWIGFGRASAVVRAAVPEAAVDEQCHSGGTEHYVGSTPETFQGRDVDSVAKPSRVEQSAHR